MEPGKLVLMPNCAGERVYEIYDAKKADTAADYAVTKKTSDESKVNFLQCKYSIKVRGECNLTVETNNKFSSKKSMDLRPLTRLVSMSEHNRFRKTKYGKVNDR